MLARKKKADPVWNWHPNFRDVATLPDIKTVRTGFIVNIIAIVLALPALAWTLYTEVEIHKVNRDIDELNAQIESNSAANSKDLSYTKSFVVTSKPMQFAGTFFAQKVSPFDLLGCLVDARPDNIVFESVEIEATGDKRSSTERITIKGMLNSESELGLQAFVDKVVASPVLKSRISDNPKDRVVQPSRSSLGGGFDFIISLTLKPV